MLGVLNNIIYSIMYLLIIIIIVSRLFTVPMKNVWCWFLSMHRGFSPWFSGFPPSTKINTSKF